MKQTTTINVGFFDRYWVRKQILWSQMFNTNLKLEYTETKHWFSSDFIITVESPDVINILAQIDEWIKKTP